MSRPATLFQPADRNDNNNVSYKAYLHGTSSVIFSLLKRTGYEISSVIEMLEKHSLAPFGGEIQMRGFNSLGATPNLCFGSLLEDSYTRYNLNTILKGGNGLWSRGYTSFSLHSEEELISDIKICCKQIREDDYRAIKYINYINLYLARFRQNGGSLDETMKKDLEGFLEHLQNRMKVYQVYSYLGKYIHLSNLFLGERDSPGEEMPFSVLIQLFINYDQLFSPRYLIENIKTIKQPWPAYNEEPSQELLSEIVDLLKAEYEEEELQLFSLEKHQYPTNASLNLNKQEWESEVHKEHVCGMIYNTRDYFRNDGENVFIKFLNNKITIEQVDSMQETFQKELALFEKRIQTFQQLTKLLNPNEFKPLTEEEKGFLENQFPILFLLEDETLVTKYSGEYRATRPLQLGQDITMVATDTKEHAEILQNYFESGGINNMEIFLISDLEQAEKTGERPTSSLSVSENTLSM